MEGVTFRVLNSSLHILHNLYAEYPCLAELDDAIREAFKMLRRCFANGHRLYLCGNGGSAADAQHIVGELMKSFVKKRQLSETFKNDVWKKYPDDAEYFLKNLQGALPAHSLTGEFSLLTAFMNDVEADMVFAQQVYGYMKPGDVLWGITTSGNSKNILNAFKVADAMNIDTMALTGKDGGLIRQVSKLTIMVPEIQTYRIQELHLPIQHALCMLLENEFF